MPYTNSNCPRRQNPPEGQAAGKAALSGNEKFQAERPYISIVVPLFNEERSVRELYSRLKDALRGIGKSFEIIFVDDGSKDDTYKIISGLAKDDPAVIVIGLARNYGQTAALSAGFDNAAGEIIISMDGDLQHDPSDLPLFIEKIDEGYDIVSGWRKERVDNLFARRLPSLMANKLLTLVSGVKIHDFGTTYKAYRREVIKNIELFGEYHRYIPALANQVGASVAEIPITNINRPKGRSNYGIGRFWPVLLDIIMLKFVVSYIARPLRLFGSIGLSVFLGGFSTALALSCLSLARAIGPLREHGAMLLLSVFLMLVGLQFIALGISAEMSAKIYFRVGDKKIYRIKRVLKK